MAEPFHLAAQITSRWGSLIIINEGTSKDPIRILQWNSQKREFGPEKTTKSLVFCTVLGGPPSQRVSPRREGLIYSTALTDLQSKETKKKKCVIVPGRLIPYVDGQDSVNTLGQHADTHANTSLHVSQRCNNYLNQFPVFWDVTLRRWLSGSRRFDPTCNFHVQGT